MNYFKSEDDSGEAIENLAGLADFCGVWEKDQDDIKSKVRLQKIIYKATACGASINFKDNGVVVGSIVEGVDGDGTQYYTLEYPFYPDKFEEILNQVEKEADELWNAANKDSQLW